MAFKLTKDERTRLASLIDNVRGARNTLEEVRDATEDALASAIDRLNDEVRVYNTELNELEAFRDEVVERLHAEFEEKSEKWQESERGQAAQELIHAWEFAVDLVELEEESHPQIEMALPEHADEMDALPLEADW